MRHSPVAEPVAEGWVLFGNRINAFWHYRLVDGRAKCMPANGPIPEAAITEWRLEPRGRHEVCPGRRRYVHDRDRRLAALAKAKAMPVPDAEPEVVSIEEEQPGAPPPPPEEKPMAETNGHHPKPAVQPVMMALGPFAAAHDLSRDLLMAFVAERLPNLPRLGVGARAPVVLDAEAQAVVLAEFPAWVEARRRATELRKSGPAPARGGDIAEVRAELAALRALLERIATELGVKP